MMVPFNHFKRHCNLIREEIDTAIDRVLSSGWFLLGPELKAFEREFASFVGTTYCVGCNSGTDSLFLSLKALEIGIGDEVITTAVTAFPTISAIQMTGATPIVVDISMRDGLIDTSQVEKAITSKTRAIIPVHLYGRCCDMITIMDIATANSLWVVEDCAQATGARWKERHAGTMGCMGCFSFYPTKNLGALGDAGAICTSDSDLEERLRSLRNYGQSDRYHHESFGVNSRLDEIQAAILRAKLPFLDSWNARRNEIATYYRRELHSQYLLEQYDDGNHVHHLFPILVENRDIFVQKLKERNVQSLVHYPLPVFKQKSFEGRHLTCSNAEMLCSQVVSLPIFPELTDDEVAFIVEQVQPLLK